MNIIVFLIRKIKMLLMYAWLILSFIPLGIGTIMMDILLSTLGVEKAYRLSTDLTNWSEVLSVYLKTKSNEIKNNTNNTNNTEGVNN